MKRSSTSSGGITITPLNTVSIKARNVESSLNQALLLNNTVAEALLKIHRSQRRQKEVCCGFVAAADSTISVTKTDHFFEPKRRT